MFSRLWKWAGQVLWLGVLAILWAALAVVLAILGVALPIVLAVAVAAIVFAILAD